MRVLAFGLAAVSLLAGTAVWAQETQTYTYDAKGRLVRVDRTGSVNNGVSASYTYDAADNRTQVTVTGASGGGGSSFSVNDASATEGGSVIFAVTRIGDTSAAQYVSYATTGQSATSGTDFTAASGTLTFAIGETSKNVSVTTLQDTAMEGAETFHLNLSSATGGATIGDPQGVGTINDDDGPVSFAIADTSVTEGGTLVFTVTKSGTTPNSYTLNHATANGTATAGSDYTAVSGSLTFGSAETSKTISVTTINDTAVESAETVLVNLSGASGGATISDAQGVGTINDNDVPPPPGFSVSDSSNYEGQSIIFTVTRSGNTAVSVSVSYATANITTGANDLTHVSGTLTFGVGETSKTVTVQTTQNSIQEDDETFALNLTNPTGGATIIDGQGVGTILNDDGEACPTCRGTSASEPAPDESAPTDPDEPGDVDGPGL